MFGIIYIMSKTLRKILEGLKADFFQLLSTFIPNFWFWNDIWVLRYTCTQFWDFSKISSFTNILNLKSFGNSLGNV